MTRHMEASEKNFKVLEEIINVMHRNQISVAQARAILEFAKMKIAEDTSVGEFIPYPSDDEDPSEQ